MKADQHMLKEALDMNPVMNQGGLLELFDTTKDVDHPTYKATTSNVYFCEVEVTLLD